MHCPNAKIYQASSSEMFGNSCDDDSMQRETLQCIQKSPYSCAKLFSYSLIRNYKIHSNYSHPMEFYLIMNHLRATNFVTTKIIKTAVQIKG